MIGTSLAPILLVFLSMLTMLFARAEKRILILAGVSLIYAVGLNQYFFLAFLLLIVVNYFTKKNLEDSRALRFFLTIFNILIWFSLKLNLSVIFLSVKMLLPLGFSIFVFQQITFIWSDRKNLSSSDFTLSDYILYSLFLGNLATGPLLDFNDYRQQLKGKLYFQTSSFYLGLTIFLLGFLKKIVFADSLSSVTYFLYESKSSFSGNLIIPFLLNKYEIYLNFLAFSEMAIGISLILGLKLKPNFNRPFATTSLISFWKRWHITLIEWIRTYVFYPLAVSPLGKLGSWFLILMTFIVFGLWHNFTLNHFFYGLIQFALVFLESKIPRSNYPWKNKYFLKTVTLLKWIWFYGILISLPALIFRSSELQNVLRVLENIWSQKLSTAFEVFAHTPVSFWSILIYIIINELIETKLKVEDLAAYIRKTHVLSQFFITIIYLIVIFYFGLWAEAGNFIYSGF